MKRTKVISFIISGLPVGLAGIMLFSQYKTAKIATAAGEELNAIAAAVVGGTLLTGGSGSIIGALLGVLIISMLRTGVVLMGRSVGQLRGRRRRDHRARRRFQLLDPPAGLAHCSGMR